MEWLVTPDGTLTSSQRRYRCALGRNGIRHDKREGDGATPAGCYPLRRLLFRPDRLAPPATGLMVAALAGDDGWCDDPAHADYNRPVTLPHPGRCERLWRDDHLYDLVIVLGHNDDPPIPWLGSAIFVHVAAPDYAPTEGCVALALPDLLALAAGADAATRLRIEAGTAMCPDRC
jgi:L,D-peptidoglycan transpeptidase YkuD (ErfK/YbiS/YcfS/YnhG family)